MTRDDALALAERTEREAAKWDEPTRSGLLDIARQIRESAQTKDDSGKRDTGHD